MGLAWSAPVQEAAETSVNEIPETGPDIIKSQEDPSPVEYEAETSSDEDTAATRTEKREKELIKFKEELAEKRQMRRQRLGEMVDEMKELREKLKEETDKRQSVEEILVRLGQSGTEVREQPRLKKCLKVSFSEEVQERRCSEDPLEEDKIKNGGEGDTEQAEKTDEKRTSDKAEEDVQVGEEALESDEVQKEDGIKELHNRNEKLENQVRALKDVANFSRQLLTIRETQVEEINNKLKMVEETGKKYEREMTAMRELKRLYEERARAMLIEHRQKLETEKTRVSLLESRLSTSREAQEELVERNKHLEDKMKNLDNQLDEAKQTISETKIKLATERESHYHASSQIKLINNLVSQIISGPELDLDKLARFLEENHSLISELTSKGDIDYVASALVGVAGGIVEIPKEEKSDIAENLGKVWRVLVELLSHHKKTQNGSNQEWESCYKSVDTPKGPKLVISVSQTFIKLKDLILEKNSLVKEVGRLKKLNEHLECRMDEQAGRLSLVTQELHNTWDVVNKLKVQHDNLHTHEKILRHELQHKRSMLTGLKKQLEICKEQWDLAREKNIKTESDWQLLRAEFAMRKKGRKFFYSAESGYEDEEAVSPEFDSDEDKSLEIEEENSDNSYSNMIEKQGERILSITGVRSECQDGIFGTQSAEGISGAPSDSIEQTKKVNQESSEDGKKQMEEVKPTKDEDQGGNKAEITNATSTNAEQLKANQTEPSKESDRAESTIQHQDHTSLVDGTLNTILNDATNKVELIETKLISKDSEVSDSEVSIIDECSGNEFEGKDEEDGSVSSDEMEDSQIGVKSLQKVDKVELTGSEEKVVNFGNELVVDYPVEMLPIMCINESDNFILNESNKSGFHLHDMSTSLDSMMIRRTLDVIEEESISNSQTDQGCIMENDDAIVSPNKITENLDSVNGNLKGNEIEKMEKDKSECSSKENIKSECSSKESEISSKDNLKSETGSPITDEILRRRDERLKRMEESCKSLFVKMGQTSNRSEQIASKLDQIHATFGCNQSGNMEENIGESSTNIGESQTNIGESFEEDTLANKIDEIQVKLGAIRLSPDQSVDGSSESTSVIGSSREDQDQLANNIEEIQIKLGKDRMVSLDELFNDPISIDSSINISETVKQDQIANKIDDLQKKLGVTNYLSTSPDEGGETSKISTETIKHDQIVDKIDGLVSEQSKLASDEQETSEKTKNQVSSESPVAKLTP